MVLEDRNRRFTFLDWTTNTPSCQAGDLVAASGHYGLKAERRGDEPYAVLKKVEVLQHGAPPAPVNRRLDGTKLQVRFNVPRRKIPDNEFHNILCIIRELVVNAVRHGRAKTVRIAGTLDGGRILFSVTDDGCGFVPATRPGMEQGHFGLEGVTERAKALDGTVRVASTPGKGTHVTVTVALLEEAGL